MNTQAISAKPSWQCIDCVADMHLRAPDATWEAFVKYLQTTPAQAIFVLGDLVDSWVGDDILEHPEHDFERHIAHVLQQASQSKDLYFMHGNRDFLIGAAFCQAAGLTMLADPTVLQLNAPIASSSNSTNSNNTRILFSHGDALCIDDTAYMQLRQQVRNPQWQQGILQMPLEQRLQLAAQMRQQSMQHQNSLGVEGHADVDTPMACQWLQANHSAILLHGHTHKPATHSMQANGAAHLSRKVLSDWDFTTTPPRADVLRLTLQDTTGWALERISLGK